MTERSFYKNTFSNFLNTSVEDFIGKMTLNDEGICETEQINAWKEEYKIMKVTLAPWEKDYGEILFEYSIPRLGKRIDVVLLLRGIVFTIEFKVGQKSYLPADKEQVMDYALDLKYFHQASHDRTIVPILVATKAKKKKYVSFPVYHDNIYKPISSNSKQLQSLIKKVIEKVGDVPPEKVDFTGWEDSRYAPTPTIIEAASSLYHNHTVTDIAHSEADKGKLEETTNYILKIIEESKQKSKKSICFVTGVPGAGKTLVGLNVAIQQSGENEKGANNDRNLAVYLSGNGPLVKVLTAALAKDKLKREKASNINEAKREVSQFIQMIPHYRSNMLAKIKLPINNKKLEIDENKAFDHDSAGYGEVEHVAIFDEAQRSWTSKHFSSWLAKGGSHGGMKKIQNFPMSEAAFLIWSLNLRKDWAVIVCLVGGGQEIYTGEAGISEWIKAVIKYFPHWNMYISKHLTEEGNEEREVVDLINNKSNVKNIKKVEQLHLSVSMRSFRAENLANFVHYVLDGDSEKARSSYSEFKDKYPIMLTRNLDKAKKWIKDKARGTERYGIVASSQAKRLKPLGIDVCLKLDVEKWFLADEKDIRSSLFLEDAATEFDIQGLELDWTCLVCVVP